MNKKELITNYLKKFKMSFILSLFLVFLSVLSYVLSPIIIGKIIDNFGKINVSHYFYILTSLICFYFLFNYLSNLILKKVILKITDELKEKYIKKINYIKISFLDNYNSGDISSRLINDIDFIKDGFVEFLLQLFNSVFTIIIIFIIMFKLNINLSFVILLFTPLIVFIPYYITKKTKSLYKSQQQIEGKISSYTKEIINNYSNIKTNYNELYFISKFEKMTKEYNIKNQKAVFYSSLANPTSRFLNGLVIIIVCLIGGKLALNKIITIGTLQVFISYASQFIKPFNEIANMTGQLSNAIASLDRIIEIYNLEEEQTKGIVIDNIEGNIELKNITFSYTEKEFIKNLSYNFQSNKKIAVVGSTGSGKTTLINLILRFYDLNEGTLMIDNKNINDISLKSYRDNLGICLQENYLFDDTILENIKYGNSTATLEKVIEICKLANCHDFIIKLPKGYNTNLSEYKLSIGQKQLICIARTMLKDPKILILDEATSDIDTLTEKKVQQALNNLIKKRSTIIIAHRLSTIKNADEIVVIDKGNIVEVGNHQTLMNRHGYYYDFYNSQFL